MKCQDLLERIARFRTEVEEETHLLTTCANNIRATARSRKANSDGSRCCELLCFWYSFKQFLIFCSGNPDQSISAARTNPFLHFVSSGYDLCRILHASVLLNDETANSHNEKLQKQMMTVFLTTGKSRKTPPFQRMVQYCTVQVWVW